MIKFHTKEQKVIFFTTVVYLFVLAIIYGLTELLSLGKEFRNNILIGLIIGLILFFIASVIRLKRYGIITDERDEQVDIRSSASSYWIIMMILLIFAAIFYNAGEVKINLGGFCILLMALMNIVYWITYLIHWRRL